MKAKDIIKELINDPEAEVVVAIVAATGSTFFPIVDKIHNGKEHVLIFDPSQSVDDPSLVPGIS